MFKAPARSKRRLATAIGSLAEELAERLCQCALEDLQSWPGPVCYAPSAEADRRWLAARPHAAAEIIMQGDGNLGERINHIDRSLRDLGFAQLIFIGIDCPLLDAHYLAEAAHLLRDNDAVLGPADDGGVVLMGASRAWPQLGALDWSSAVLGAQLAALCDSQDWRIARLPQLADTDTVEDLAPLARRLRSDLRPARLALRDWLARHTLDRQTVPQ
jgi:glycosyltransferase A (GT-A) superfamily protein (DUF2064 family)